MGLVLSEPSSFTWESLVVDHGPVEALMILERLEARARELAAEDDAKGWCGRAEAHRVVAAGAWCDQRNLVHAFA